MKTLTLDSEITTHAKGNPFSRRNHSVCWSWKRDTKPAKCNMHTWKKYKTPIQQAIDTFKPLLIFFNAKFDIHWGRNDGIDLTGCPIWCCQLAEYILENQRQRYPSLEDTAVKYGLGHKEDVVKTVYWDQGVCTKFVPWHVLSSYANQDVELTYKVYQKQLEQFEANPRLYRLFKQACADLLVLLEMEKNGIWYDAEMCREKEVEAEAELTQIKEELAAVYPNIPINFNSNDDLSAFLYGGVVTETAKELDGFYKSGAKKGMPKYKNVKREHQLPRLCEPIKRSETKKPGFWKTSKDLLVQLKGPYAKKYVSKLLRLADLDKQITSYYRKLPSITQEMDWEPGVLHGQLNQCVTATGRLSADIFNQQNMAGNSKNILISRYTT